MKRWTKNLKEIEKKLPQATIAVSSYNKPRELGLCLEGYRRQSFLEKPRESFQLILADDGSVPEIEKIFLDFSQSVTFPVTFLQQEHQGWRKPRVLNWAIAESL